MVSMATLRAIKRALDQRLIAKAAPTPTVRRTLREAVALARQLAEEFRAFGETLPAARLEAAIASGLVGQINLIIDWAVMGTRLSDELKPAIRGTYLTGAKEQDRKFRSQGIKIRFDVMSPRAEQWASRYAGRLVTEITEDQRLGVSRLIEAAQRDGRTPKETADALREIVGLHSRQVAARERYRRELLAQETPPEKLARLLDRYTSALRNQRAMVIARTELLRSTHEGQIQLAREGLQQGLLDKDRTFRKWIVTDDDRLDTELCLPMSEPDQGEVRIDEPWMLPDGREAWTPQDSHPNCFLGSVRVAGVAQAGLQVWYEGPIYELKTAKGYRVSITPNHPIATPNGLRAARDLVKGDEILCDTRPIWRARPLGHVDDHEAPTAIEQIADALRTQGCTTAQIRALDLHGDARCTNGQVEIVGANWTRADEAVDTVSQCLPQTIFQRGTMQQALGDGPRAFSLGRHTIAASASGTPRTLQLSLNQIATLLDPAPFLPLRIGPTTDWDTALTESAKQNASAYAQFVRQLLERSAGIIAADIVTDIRVREFVGHVYDLQMANGFIVAEGIVTSNCRCTFSMIVKAPGEPTP